MDKAGPLIQRLWAHAHGNLPRAGRGKTGTAKHPVPGGGGAGPLHWMTSDANAGVDKVTRLVDLSPEKRWAYLSNAPWGMLAGLSCLPRFCAAPGGQCSSPASKRGLNEPGEEEEPKAESHFPKLGRDERRTHPSFLSLPQESLAQAGRLAPPAMPGRKRLPRVRCLEICHAVL
eukprot:611553-Amphidinium_carterae.2